MGVRVEYHILDPDEHNRQNVWEARNFDISVNEMVQYIIRNENPFGVEIVKPHTSADDLYRWNGEGWDHFLATLIPNYHDNTPVEAPQPHPIPQAPIGWHHPQEHAPLPAFPTVATHVNDIQELVQNMQWLNTNTTTSTNPVVTVATAPWSLANAAETIFNGGGIGIDMSAGPVDPTEATEVMGWYLGDEPEEEEEI